VLVAHHIQGNPFRIANDICESADSEASCTLMKGWIDRCFTTHNHPPAKPHFKPTRLIRLAKNEIEGAQLCSPTMPVEFAALSYRWGSDNESRTLQENLAERYKRLDISSLPKTLRDAIKITRGLEIEYLWIDRLCIAQDDTDEWTKEASFMADIYASAHIVLSATATEDCKAGFLWKRAEPLELKCTPHDGQTLKVRARQVESHGCRRNVVNTDYTLFDRAWCMQERLLAKVEENANAEVLATSLGLAASAKVSLILHGCRLRKALRDWGLWEVGRRYCGTTARCLSPIEEIIFQPSQVWRLAWSI
jgi:hypothetical protein